MKHPSNHLSFDEMRIEMSDVMGNEPVIDANELMGMGMID